jgi:hypothetical protein
LHLLTTNEGSHAGVGVGLIVGEYATYVVATHEAHSHLAYVLNGEDAVTVVIDDKIVMRDGCWLPASAGKLREAIDAVTAL